MDVVVAGKTAAIHYGKGAGELTAPGLLAAEAAASPLAVAVADWDGDAILDVIIADAMKSLVLLRGASNRTFESPRVLTAGLTRPTLILPVDVDRDGRLDITVLGRLTQAAVSILLNNGNGSFSEPEIHAVPM